MEAAIIDGADPLQLRPSIKSRRFQSDHERLLPLSPPQETEPLAA